MEEAKVKDFAAEFGDLASLRHQMPPSEWQTRGAATWFLSSATIDFLVDDTQDSRKNVTFNGEGAHS